MGARWVKSDFYLGSGARYYEIHTLMNSKSASKAIAEGDPSQNSES